MKRADALDRAKQIVTQRNASYGAPEDNFARIARLWSAHLVNQGIIATGLVIELHDVAILLALMKMARLASDPLKADSWIDAAGYMACGAEVAEAVDDLRRGE